MKKQLPAPTTKIMSATEQKYFQRLEQICVEGRTVFYLVGNALTEIKEKHFYLSKGFQNFEQYCDSIGYSKRHCNQLILDAFVMKELPDNIKSLVKSQRAVRELGKLPAPVREQVALTATNGGKQPLTAPAVKALSPPPRPRAKPIAVAPARALQAPAAVPEVLDETGVPVPAETLPLWTRADGDDVRLIIGNLDIAANKIKKMQEAKDKVLAEVDVQDVLSKLSMSVIELKLALPFAVCSSCQGKLPEGCTICKGRGYVSRFFWKTCVPEETRLLRPKGWKG